MTDCQRFDRRMQERLDAREAIDDDVMLREHAASCAACRQRREAWLRIERGLLPASGASEVGHGAASGWRPSRGDRSLLGRMTIVAAAAALLMMVAVRRFDAAGPESSSVVVVASGDRATGGRVPKGMMVADVSAPWIGEFSKQAWFDRTMPAVRSVRDGVAPLGRSFLQAVAILSHGGGPSRDASFDRGSGTGSAPVGGRQTS